MATDELAERLKASFRRTLRTVPDRALAFDLLVPNEETIEAMKTARRGELVTVGGVDDLLADLHAEELVHRPRRIP